MSKHISETAVRVLAQRLGIPRDEIVLQEHADLYVQIRKEVELVLSCQPVLNTEDMSIVNGWLVVETGECGCGGGGSDMGYHHMPMCNYEPYLNLADVLKQSGYVLAAGETS